MLGLDIHSHVTSLKGWLSEYRFNLQEFALSMTCYVPGSNSNLCLLPKDFIPVCNSVFLMDVSEKKAMCCF